MKLARWQEILRRDFVKSKTGANMKKATNPVLVDFKVVVLECAHDPHTFSAHDRTRRTESLFA